MSELEDAISRVRRWRIDPVAFVRENFEVEPDAWQIDALRHCGGDYIPNRRMAMKACTGPGKSTVLAWVGWHRLACFAAKGEHPKGAALSSTGDNLKDNLWAELAKWQARSKFLSAAFTWTKERIYANDHPETWFLSARSFAKDADAEAIGRALSGLHSKFPFILLDETGDMPVSVGRAAMQIFTGMPLDALIAQAGNPTSTDGLLYDSCTNGAALWRITTITADPDDPKRTPRVSIEHAREMIATQGRDNPWVMATILGLFPPAGFRSLLGIEEVTAAMGRHIGLDKYQHAARVIGVDVGRFGDDPSIIFPRQGLAAFQPTPLRNVNSEVGAGFVQRKWTEWDADACFVDGTGGYGAGWIDMLGTLGRTCFDVQFAGRPSDPKYFNKRAEIWWEGCQWVKNGGCLPNVPELVAELTVPTYSFKGDKLIVEDKDQIKKRLGRSPNYADALFTTFAEPVHVDRRLKGYEHLIGQSMAGRAKTDYDPFARA